MISDGGTAGANVYGRYCKDIFFTGRPISRHGASFVLPRGSSLTHNLSLATHHLVEHGLLLPLDDHFVKQGKCPPTSQKPSLKLDQLSVFFIIAFMVCGLICLEMMFDPQNEPEPPSVTTPTTTDTTPTTTDTTRRTESGADQPDENEDPYPLTR